MMEYPAKQYAGSARQPRRRLTGQPPPHAVPAAPTGHHPPPAPHPAQAGPDPLAHQLIQPLVGHVQPARLHAAPDQLARRQRLAGLAQQGQDQAADLSLERDVPLRRRAHPHRVEVYVGREQAYGGVQAVYVQDQLAEVRLRRLYGVGDFLALADQAGEDGVAEVWGVHTGILGPGPGGWYVAVVAGPT